MSVCPPRRAPRCRFPLQSRASSLTPPQVYIYIYIYIYIHTGLRCWRAARPPFKPPKTSLCRRRGMWSGGADSLGVPAWQEVVLKEESYNLELVVWRASSQSRWTGYPTLRRGVISLAPCCSCSSSGGTWLAARLVCVPYILGVGWAGPPRHVAKACAAGCLPDRIALRRGG